MASSKTTRKLTAILCADVVGYSRLMGENEAATVRLLTEYRQVFSEYIEKFLGWIVDAKGDAIMAEFASVVDAVESAAEIQRELAERNAMLLDERRMLFRIGVNHGDVMVRAEELYGDAVNIAARLALGRKTGTFRHGSIPPGGGPGRRRLRGRPRLSSASSAGSHDGAGSLPPVGGADGDNCVDSRRFPVIPVGCGKRGRRKYSFPLHAAAPETSQPPLSAANPGKRMAKSPPSHAQVVIIGGGIVGCSVAYHLTKLGWRDVVLLERRQLTCGTTWHAAGLVGQLRATQNMTRLAQYTAGLFAGLEGETGQGTGFKQNGSISIATTPGRLEELKRGASMAKTFGLEVELTDGAELRRMWPLMNVKDVIGAIFLPKDGQTNPVDTTMALARGARMGGATLLEDMSVTGILTGNGVVKGVSTETGEIQSEFVVNCGGMWAREIGLMCGVNVPLHACEHFYIVTEPMPGLTPQLPVLRDPDGMAYFKEDAGKLLMGGFEPIAKPWGMNGIPPDFCFDQIPFDLEHFKPVLDAATNRIPELEAVGIQTFFNGPESFTPDDRYLLGEAPELRNFFVAAGFNSVGIQSAGGAGKVLADWIVNGHPPMDLWDVDIRRMAPFQGNSRYLLERAKETLGLLYAMHWPYRQFETARGVRVSPLHGRLERAGACFGEAAGWERANWFAPKGKTARYEYSYGRQNWFDYSGQEHLAVREAVALFDQTSFAKFRVDGRGAERALQFICANNVAVPPGRVVYTPWLNQRGGIEADLTVTRLSEDAYLVVTSAAAAIHHLTWLKRHIPKDSGVTVTDVTSAYAVLGLMGPHSRALLATLTGADLSNEGFPFGTARELEVGYARTLALRITYVGELGWELYIPTEFAPGVFDRLIAEGERFGLRLAGMHAMDSCRIEKGYRSWGHDISGEDTPIEAGLGFACDLDKSPGFLGQDALLSQKERGVTRRLVQFKLEDSRPLLYHNEPIYRDGKMAGFLTSGNYGHTLGRAVGLGYVRHSGGITAEFIRSGTYEIEVACERIPASASLKPLYDPENKRIRA